MKTSTAKKTSQKSIFGQSKTEQLSAQILPILVRQAKAHKTITYGALAKEINTHPRVIGQCLGIIGNALYSMEGEKKPPLLNACVINQETGEPSAGVDEFMMQRLPFEVKDRKVAIQLFLEQCFGYTHWNEILRKLSLKPVVGDLNRMSAEGNGESIQHKSFKDYVSQHPEIFQLPAKIHSTKEYELKSGDRIDVVFENESLRRFMKKYAQIPSLMRLLGKSKILSRIYSSSLNP